MNAMIPFEIPEFKSLEICVYLHLHRLLFEFAKLYTGIYWHTGTVQII